jgi:tagatose 1,6-diphosphate aldolase
MTRTLSPGQWRGLQTTSTDTHLFAIVAFDQRGNYRRMLPDNTPHDQAVQIKYEVVKVLAPHTSAILLDPIYGLKAALHGLGRSGLLMCVEKTGYTGDSTYRSTDFIPGWSVGKIKQMGAAAAKLLIYYHPDSGALAGEIEGLIQDVATQCRQRDLPLFVEPLSYSLDANIAKNSPVFAQHRPALVRETARRLSQCGADVLKLEFPVDVAFETDQSVWARACEAISMVCDIPWVLLSAGVDFDLFQQQVRVACQAGASGFLGGRAIWKECINMTPANRQQFLETTAVDRLHTLTDFARTLARPWTDFFTALEPVEGWFEDYVESKGLT